MLSEKAACKATWRAPNEQRASDPVLGLGADLALETGIDAVVSHCGTDRADHAELASAFLEATVATSVVTTLGLSGPTLDLNHRNWFATIPRFAVICSLH